MSILSNILPTSATQPTVTQLTPATSGSTTTSRVSFSDVLDAVNPLQHIPVISNIYRSVTGSTISAGSKIVGDTLFGAMVGGPILAGAAMGFSAAVADVAVTQTTGSDITTHVLNTVGLGSSTTTTAASSVSNPTTLVANPSLNAAAVAANNSLQTPQQQATAAAALILRPGAHPERTNAQYERAQAFDAINKSLVKIKV